MSSCAGRSGIRTAILVHRPQPQIGGSDAQSAFRRSDGLTLLDLHSGYGRPLTIPGSPEQLVLVDRPSASAQLWIMHLATTTRPGTSGVMRIDLDSYRADRYTTPRPPTTMGLVAGKIFVSQESSQGRITFFDLDSGAQRTVSGYELNARID
jgi:hypothetical protein